MSESDMVGVIALVIGIPIILIPYIWVLTSDRSHGGAKFGWFLVTLFFSWLGLAVFRIFTQTSKDRRDQD